MSISWHSMHGDSSSAGRPPRHPYRSECRWQLPNRDALTARSPPGWPWRQTPPSGRRRCRHSCCCPPVRQSCFARAADAGVVQGVAVGQRAVGVAAHRAAAVERELLHREAVADRVDAPCSNVTVLLPGPTKDGVLGRCRFCIQQWPLRRQPGGSGTPPSSYHTIPTPLPHRPVPWHIFITLTTASRTRGTPR